MNEALLYFFIAINIITFLVFGYDKWLAKNNKRRISEQNLLLISLFFGSVGGIFGMFIFRHKISKWSFLWKFILIIIFQIIFFIFLNLQDFRNLVG